MGWYIEYLEAKDREIWSHVHVILHNLQAIKRFASESEENKISDELDRQIAYWENILNGGK